LYFVGLNKKNKIINLYFQDESRFVLFTKKGKALTVKGIKPICPFQQVFQSLYLFGAFSSINGNNCNANSFQLFLNEFSKQNKEELKVIVLNNGAFHKAKSLVIPDNIVLVFLPPYSPELNPAEKMWAKFKRDFSAKLFKNMELLELYICSLVNSLTKNEVISICSFSYIFFNAFWTIE